MHQNNPELEQEYLDELEKLAIEILSAIDDLEQEDIGDMMFHINEFADWDFEIFKQKRSEIKDLILKRRKMAQEWETKQPAIPKKNNDGELIAAV